MPQMLKDGDEESDSDGSFEAVTPERTTPEFPKQETATIGKHRHILQDVDGELEMEDVAPEVEMIPTENSQNVEQQYPPPPPHSAPALTVLPLSPQLISPLPHPAPPPPPPPLPLHPPDPIGSAMSDCHVNGPHQNSHSAQVILRLLPFLSLCCGRTSMFQLLALLV